MLFLKKQKKSAGYKKENKIAVIRSSICTGEKVAGFKDVTTNKFEEIMLIQTDRDFENFLNQYELKREEVKKEW